MHSERHFTFQLHKKYFSGKPDKNYDLQVKLGRVGLTKHSSFSLGLNNRIYETVFVVANIYSIVKINRYSLITVSCLS